VSPPSKIADPHPISSVRNRHLRIPVAKIAVEKPRFILPAYTITDAPLRGDAGGWWSSAPGALLACFTGFTTRKAGSVGHCTQSRNRCHSTNPIYHVRSALTLDLRDFFNE
jgi:hypothetical protein